MGIFSRIGDIMKANVNDLIDKAEDPEKMVKQIIRDLQQEVAKSTQALGKAMASQRIAERQYKTALQSSADWESKAKAALAAGNTEMAKKALSYKVKADNDVASYQQMYETITTQTDAIRNQVETLKAKLEEAKSRQAMLIARSQMAKTQKNLAQSMGGINTSSFLWINLTAWKKRLCSRKQKLLRLLKFPAIAMQTPRPLNRWKQIPRWMQNCSV